MRWIRNAKVATKLSFLIISSLIFIILVGGLGFLNMQKMSEQTTTMYNDNLLPGLHANDLRAQTRANEALLKELILNPNSPEADDIIGEISERGKTSVADVEAYYASNLTDYEKERLSKIESLVTEIQTERAKLYPIIEKGDTRESFDFYKTKIAQPIDNLNAVTEELANFNAESAEKALLDVQKKATTTMIWMAVIILFAAILSIALGLVISRILTKPIKELVSDMEKAGEGDLTVQGTNLSKDEIGVLVTSFNQMISNMRKAIGEVTENANSLAASAEEISASTEEIASGSAQQAQDANTSADMVTEMTNAIQEVSENAQSTATLSEKTTTAAEQGGVVIAASVSSMGDITENIRELADKSVQIGEIIEVIDDIAEQTNLLALNAAIEAARAGDAGKGFAVVADEVRKLAERSSKATKEISELISTIQTNTQRAVESVLVGNEKVENAGTTFNDIVALVKKSAARVSEIAAASEEQAAQAGEVLLAVQNIASVTEETAAGIEETASTATDLAHMAETLNQLATRFKI